MERTAFGIAEERDQDFAGGRVEQIDGIAHPADDQFAAIRASK